MIQLIKRRMGKFEQIDPNFHWVGLQKHILNKILDLWIAQGDIEAPSQEQKVCNLK